MLASCVLLSACGRETTIGGASLTGSWGVPERIADAGERPVNVASGGGRSRGISRPTLPKLAVGAQGSAVALWHAAGEDGFRLYESRLEPGQGWGPPEPVADRAGTDQHAIAVTSAGQAIAVWWRDTRLESSRSSPGQGWGPVETIADGGGPQIRARDSGTWEEARTIVSAPGYTDSGYLGLNLAASAAGTAVVAWKHRDGNTYTVWTSHLAGGRWGPPELIRTRGSELSTPEVAMDDAGNAVVAWIETEGIRANIVAARLEVARGRGGDAAP